MIGLICAIKICIGLYLLGKSLHDVTIKEYICDVVLLYLCLIVMLIGIVGFQRSLGRTRFVDTLNNIISGMVGGSSIQRLVDKIVKSVSRKMPEQVTVVTPELVEKGITTFKKRLDVMRVLDKLHSDKNPQSAECGICYEKLTGDLSECPKCGNLSHYNCLKDWLDADQQICVYCRHYLISQ